MRIVFLVEEGIQNQFQTSRFWADESFLATPLSELNSFNAQMVGRGGMPKGPVVNGFVLGVILNANSNDATRATVIQSLSKFMHPKFAEDAFFLVSNATQIDDLMCWIIGRHRLAATIFAEFSAQSDLALASLRKIFLETQEALGVANKTLAKISYPNLFLADEITQATVQQMTKTGLVKPFSISQTTWREVETFKRVDLYFMPGGFTGSVTVEVKGAYSSRPIATWTRPHTGLRKGWNAFTCARERGQLNELLEIKVIWLDETTAPIIGMGESLADESATALLANSHHLDRPLALRIWQQVLSATLEQSNEGEFLAVDEPLSDSMPPSELLSLVAFYTGPVHAKPEDHVEWRNEQGSMLVHPAGRQPMVATLECISVRRLRRISAMVYLDHPKAAATEFAIVARRPEQDFKPTVLSNLAQRFGRTEKKKVTDALVKTAHWIRLEAGERGKVTCDFNEPYSGTLSIFLMTRNASDKNAFSWAFFTGMTFDVAEG